MIKNFKTINEQIEILKDKGLIIEDESTIRRYCLKKIISLSWDIDIFL